MTPKHPTIALSPVKSSQIESIGYDPATKTLACKFSRGAGHVYHYHDVTPEMHAKFLAAESIGKFFGQHIKPLKFTKLPKP